MLTDEKLHEFMIALECGMENILWLYSNGEPPRISEQESRTVEGASVYRERVYSKLQTAPSLQMSTDQHVHKERPLKALDPHPELLKRALSRAHRARRNASLKNRWNIQTFSSGKFLLHHAPLPT